MSPSPRPPAFSVIRYCEKRAPSAAEICTMARQFDQPGSVLATWLSGREQRVGLFHDGASDSELVHRRTTRGVSSRLPPPLCQRPSRNTVRPAAQRPPHARAAACGRHRVTHDAGRTATPPVTSCGSLSTDQREIRVAADGERAFRGKRKRRATLAAVRRAIRSGVEAFRSSRHDGSRCCTPAIPPHTRKKFASVFIVQGDGEWSLPIVSTRPART